MSEGQTREYRYERKFLVDQLDVHQVLALVKLHPAMFYQPYPPRYVNNLYLDTEGLDNYQDNVSGVGDRRKVRLRWYGDLFGDVDRPVLEFKIKRGWAILEKGPNLRQVRRNLIFIHRLG